MDRSGLGQEMRSQWRLAVAGPVLMLGLAAWLGWRSAAGGEAAGGFWDRIADATGGMAWPALFALAGATALAADGERRSRWARARQGAGRLAIGWFCALLVGGLLFSPVLLAAMAWGSVKYPPDAARLLEWWLPVFGGPIMTTAISLVLLGVGACLGKLFRKDIVAACVAAALVAGGLWGFSWLLPRLTVFRHPATEVRLLACLASCAALWIVVSLLLHALEARSPAPASKMKALLAALFGVLATASIVGGLLYTGLRPFRLDPDHVFLTDLET